MGKLEHTKRKTFHLNADRLCGSLETLEDGIEFSICLLFVSSDFLKAFALLGQLRLCGGKPLLELLCLVVELLGLALELLLLRHLVLDVLSVLDVFACAHIHHV